jgi:RNA polymerase sigma-54 factor
MGRKRVRITQGLREALEWLTLSKSSLGDRLRGEIIRNPCLEEELDLPFPRPAPIEADLVVERTMRGLRVALDREGLPRLRLRALGRNGDDPASGRHFSRRARWVLAVLKRREEILARVGRAVAEAQRAYLDGQAERPMPLTVTATARRVGLHPSTVSRVIRHKLVLAPRGVVELASLCGRATGEAREAVRALLASDEGAGQLTDRRIAELLAARGVVLSRRTVSKYRRALGVVAARRRRAAPDGAR